MECPNCQRSYEQFASGDQDVIPRILTVCGHSLCHKCVVSLYQQKHIECPLCKTINPGETVNEVSENINLTRRQSEQVEMQQSSSAGQQSSKNRSSSFSNINSNSFTTLQNFTQQQIQNNSICSEHQKSIEAFCWTDKQTLCIDCILQNKMHKQHDVLSIEKSISKQDLSLSLTEERTQSVKLKLQQSLTQLNQFKQHLDMQEIVQLNKLTNFYNEVKDLIEQKLKSQFLSITESIETKREWIFKQELVIKDHTNSLSQSDFQLLQSQLTFQSTPIDQVLAFVEKDKKMNQAIDNCEDFCAQIIQNKSVLQTQQFQPQIEIQNLLTIVNEICQLYGEPSISSSFLEKTKVKKQQQQQFATSPVKKSLHTNRISHRDLSQINTQTRKSLIVKEASTARKLTGSSAALNKDEQTPTLPKNASRLQNSIGSKLNSIPSKAQLSQSNNKQQERPSTSLMMQRQSILSTQKQEKALGKNNQTPMKPITESKKTSIMNTQIINRKPTLQRNTSRAPVSDKDASSQPNTNKFSTSNTNPRQQQQQTVQKELNFEQQLRQSLSNLATPSNNAFGHGSRTVSSMQKQNSKSFMQRLNDQNQTTNKEKRLTGQSSQTPKISMLKKQSSQSPHKSMMVPQSNNISRLHIHDLMNRSVEESDNEDNSSFCSIQKLNDQLPNLIQQRSIALNPNETLEDLASAIETGRPSVLRNRPQMDQILTHQMILNTSVQSLNNTLTNNLQLDQDQDQKRPFLQTTNLLDLKEINNDSQLMSARPSISNLNNQSVRSQAGRNSLRGPSLRDKRNELKQEKRQSLARQLESEQWITRQTQNVENLISHARQISSRRDESSSARAVNGIPIINNLTDKHNHNFIHFSNQNNSTILNKLSALQQSQTKSMQQLQTLSREDKSSSSSNSENQNMSQQMRREEEISIIDKADISILSNFYPQSNNNVNQLINQMQSSRLQRKVSQEKEKKKQYKQQVIGVISPSNEFNIQVIGLDLIKHENLQVQQNIEIANFNHLLGQRFQVVKDPRSKNSFLIIGGKFENGEYNKKVLEFDSKLQIVEESDVLDLPLTFIDSQFSRTCTGHYSSKSSKIPLLIVALTKKQPDIQDSIDFYNFCSLELLSYDFSSNEWDPIPQLPSQFSETCCPQSDFQLLLHENSIYLIGGTLDGQVLKNGFRFDLERQEWLQISEMSDPRTFFACSSVEGLGLAVSGGYDGNKILNSCESYDPVSDTWILIPPLNLPRMYHSGYSSLTDPNSDQNIQTLTILGGIDSEERILNSVETFDLDLNKWVLKEVMSEDGQNAVTNKMWYNHTIIQLTM